MDESLTRLTTCLGFLFFFGVARVGTFGGTVAVREEEVGGGGGSWCL